MRIWQINAVWYLKRPSTSVNNVLPLQRRTKSDHKFLKWIFNRAPIYIDASKSFDPDIVQGSLVSDILYESNDVTGFEEPPTFPTLGIDLTNNLCTGGSSSYLECLKFSWNCTVLHRRVFFIFSRNFRYNKGRTAARYKLFYKTRKVVGK